MGLFSKYPSLENDFPRYNGTPRIFRRTGFDVIIIIIIVVIHGRFE